jgi:antitoxin (DNA-binding transcriptional repressor) of toxin-antitoxin stability system
LRRAHRLAARSECRFLAVAPLPHESIELVNLTSKRENCRLLAEVTAMKTMTVGEFKSRFSEALDAVRDGETIVVSYGRNHRKVAAMVPYSDLKSSKKRPLGLLKSKARVKFDRDFALTDEELLKA